MESGRAGERRVRENGESERENGESGRTESGRMERVGEGENKESERT